MKYSLVCILWLITFSAAHAQLTPILPQGSNLYNTTNTYQQNNTIKPKEYKKIEDVQIEEQKKEDIKEEKKRSRVDYQTLDEARNLLIVIMMKNCPVIMLNWKKIKSFKEQWNVFIKI